MNARTTSLNRLPLADSPASDAAQRASTIDAKILERVKATRLAYWGVLLFVLIYCARPNDWLPRVFLNFRFAMFAAIIALAGMLFAFMKTGIRGMPRELHFVLFLFMYLVLTIPFSFWPGGSFEVMAEFAKVVLIAVCTALSLSDIKRLRNVLLVQTAVIGGMAILSAAGKGYSFVDPAGQKRLLGVVGGIFQNPNDYAFALALVFPVGVFFMLQTKNVVAKLVWGAMLLAMVYCVVLTLSRGGLLALAAAVLLVLWQFGIKRKRRYLIPLAVLGALAIVAVSPGQFAARVESIFNPTLDATGSGWARRELLSRAIDVTLASPLLGVGPGNFPVLSGNWKGAHNTYLQLSAEGGIPALLIYFVILGYSFRNLRRIQRQSSDPQIQDLTSALFAALGCYVIGAFFADTVYHFFPFLIFGYVSALYIYVTSLAQPAEGVEAAGSARESQKVPQARSNPFLEGWQRDKGAARLASLRETHVRNRRNR